MEQLPQMYMDMAQGRQEFTPGAEETNSLIRSYYSKSRGSRSGTLGKGRRGSAGIPRTGISFTRLMYAAGDVHC